MSAFAFETVIPFARADVACAAPRRGPP